MSVEGSFNRSTTLGDSFHEFRGFNGQCVRECYDVEQSDIPFSAFNSSDVVPMQTSKLGQTFLRQTTTEAQLANVPAE